MTQMLFSSKGTDDNHLPNLLIYFPTPLNFFLYYSAKNQSQNTSEISVSTNEQPGPNISARMFPSEKSVPNRSKIDKTPYSKETDSVRVSSESDPETNHKSDKIDKQRELEYIGKIVRKLIEYWDEEEKSYANSRRRNNELANKNIERQNKPGGKIGFRDSSAESESIKSTDKGNTKSTFDLFLEWLMKNSTIAVRIN